MGCIALLLMILTMMSFDESVSLCGGTFSSDNGTFYSPYIPSAYFKTTRCRWTINVDHGYIIRLTFIFGVRFAMDTECSYDSVKIFDVFFDGSRNLLGTWCGSQTPTVWSASSKIYVEFTIDNTNVFDFKMFGASWTKLERVVVDLSCDFDNPNRRLCGYRQETPGGAHWRWHQGSTPSTNTGPGDDHTRADTTGHYVYFEASGINPYVTARLSSPDFSITDQLCLSFWYFMHAANVNALNVYVSDGNLLHSNPNYSMHGEQGNGWKAAHIDLNRTVAHSKIIVEAVGGIAYDGDIAVDDINVVRGTCAYLGDSCGGVFNTDSGRLHSPNYPSKYTKNARCQWTISVEDGFLIELTFRSDFKLEDYHDCKYDSVKVFNVLSNGNRNLRGTWCGSQPPPVLVSSSSQVVVEFTSDESKEFKGFSASWQKIANLSCDFDNPTRRLCGYRQETSGGADWRWHQGSIPSSDTGPGNKHTRADTTGHYVYFKAPNIHRDAKARLISPTLFTPNQRCLSFWYFADGAFVDNALSVYVPDGNTVKGVPKWTMHKKQGNSWRAASVDIEPTSTGSKIIFEAIRGRIYEGIIALDNISVSYGKCSVIVAPKDNHTSDIMKEGGEEGSSVNVAIVTTVTALVVICLVIVLIHFRKRKIRQSVDSTQRNPHPGTPPPSYVSVDSTQRDPRPGTPPPSYVSVDSTQRDPRPGTPPPSYVSVDSTQRDPRPGTPPPSYVSVDSTQRDPRPGTPPPSYVSVDSTQRDPRPGTPPPSYVSVDSTQRDPRPGTPPPSYASVDSTQRDPRPGTPPPSYANVDSTQRDPRPGTPPLSYVSVDSTQRDPPPGTPPPSYVSVDSTQRDPRPGTPPPPYESVMNDANSRWM